MGSPHQTHLKAQEYMAEETERGSYHLGVSKAGFRIEAPKEQEGRPEGKDNSREQCLPNTREMIHIRTPRDCESTYQTCIGSNQTKS